MQFLKTNTAVRISVGPFLDKTDGVTPETGLTVTSCHLTLVVDADDGSAVTLALDANATASGGNNDMVHVSGDDAGYYDLELTATNLNYLGRAKLAITDAATHCPVFHEFMILPAMVYDSLVKATDRLDTNVTHIADTAQTARDIGASVLLSSGSGTGQLDFTSGVVKANATQFAGQTITCSGGVTIPAATLASTTNITAGTITTVTTVTNQLTAAQIATGVWQDTTSGDFTVASSIGKSLYTSGVVPGASGGLFIAGSNAATTVNFTGNLSGSVGSVTGLTASNLDTTVSSRMATYTQPTGFLAATFPTTVASTTNITAGTITTVTTLTGHTPQTGDSYAYLAGANAVETGIDFKKAIQAIGAVTVGKIADAGTGTETYKCIGGSTTRVTVTVDSSGNRSAVVIS